jgi:Zn-dependent peptidase ImmA (M78 family)/DNA-binding XRE family transcriptional regulator
MRTKEERLQDFGKRLRQARIKEKLSMEELCQKIDGKVTQQSISKYEQGKMYPDSGLLNELTRVLNINQDFLFRPFSIDLTAMEVAFRKKSSVPKKEVESVKVKVQDSIERYMEIDQILDISPTFKVTSVHSKLSSPDDMRQEAQKLRKEWQLGLSPIANTAELLESKGVNVVYIDGPEGFAGLSGKVNGKVPFIVLNNNDVNRQGKISIERRRFTTMHEYCHLRFGDKFPADMDGGDIERLCDAFASEMLLPSEVLERFVEGKSLISAKELTYLQTVYGISVDAIMHKLNALKLISGNRYRGYCINKNKDASLCAYYEKSRFSERKSELFETKVYRALANNLLSVSKAAVLLNTSVNDVRQHLNVV